MKAPLYVALSWFVITAAIAALPPRNAAPDYAALGRRIVGELAARHFRRVEARFDARMAQALPENKLAAVWDGLVAQAGALQRIVGTEATEVRGVHVITVHCRFERAALDVQLSFDADGRVAGLFFRPGKPATAESHWALPLGTRTGQFHKASVTFEGGEYAQLAALTLPHGGELSPAGASPIDEDRVP